MSSNLYNIHNLISIEIDNGLENTNRVYDFLECIHNGSNQSANINKCYKVIVQKVDEISTSAHREYFNGIFISPNSLIDKNYGIEVFFNEDAIILKTKFRFIEWMMYSIQLALLRVDCVIIHGAAIAKDGNAVLFPSWGGVGKTAILNDFAKKYQHKIIGDDLFILDKKGNIFAFPKPMVLYPYHKNLFPEIFQKNPSLIPSGLSKYMSRLVPKVKKLLSPFPSLMNFARNHNPQVKWVLPTEVFGFDNVCWNSTVQKIFWLERSIEPSILQYDNPNLCSQILGSTINEFDQRVVYSINVLMGLGILSNDYYLKRWYEVLEAGLEMAKKGRINVNSSVTIDEIGEFIKDFLENMRNKLLIVTTEKRLELNKNGLIVNGDNTRALSFWQRYLDVFDKVIIVARVEKKNKIQSENLVEKFGQIEVFCLTNYQGLKEGLMKRSVIAAEINNLLSTYPNAYFLLRIPGFISNLIASKLIKNRMNYSVEVVGDPYDVFSTQNGPLSKILAWQSRRILKRNLYYAISAAYVTASSLQQRYPFVGFQTYYSSINLSESFFNYNKIFINEPKLSIIGIGSLEMPYKGVDILLASLKLLSKRNIPFSLTWLGGGSLMSSYKTIAQDYGLVKDVHFTGSVTNAEIPKYLNNNNIFLLPSKTEGLPRAMIEAMASGLICLGSNVGGIPELLNNECLFSCNDPKQLADKLDFVYNNFENFKKYSNINIEKAKEYLPDILKKRRIKFYESLLMN